MKLIFAEDDDETANIVCKWLLFNSISFTRVNVTDDVDLKSLTISNTSDVSLKLNNIPDLIISQSASINHKFWFRRGNKGITIKSDNFDFNDCYVYWNRRSQLVKYSFKSKLSDLEYKIEMGYL